MNEKWFIVIVRAIVSLELKFPASIALNIFS